jgi:fructose-bisphosphate aldolase class 1
MLRCLAIVLILLPTSRALTQPAAMDRKAELIATAKQLCTPGKGILAADESTSTAGKRVRAAAAQP